MFFQWCLRLPTVVAFNNWYDDMDILIDKIGVNSTNKIYYNMNNILLKFDTFLNVIGDGKISSLNNMLHRSFKKGIHVAPKFPKRYCHNRIIHNSDELEWKIDILG